MPLPREGQEEVWSGQSICGGRFQALYASEVSFIQAAHLKAMAVGLEATNAILPSPLYTDPMLPLVATLAIFKAILSSPSVVLKDKG